MTPSLRRTCRCPPARSDALRRRRRLAAIATDHPLTGLHHIVVGVHDGISALPACRRTLCHCRASCSTNVTSSSLEPEVPPQRRLMHTGVKFWTFLTSKEGVDLYADRFIREYNYILWYLNFHVK